MTTFDFVQLAYFSRDNSSLGRAPKASNGEHLGIAKKGFFTGWMPFLSHKHNQQCRNSEGIKGSW